MSSRPRHLGLDLLRAMAILLVLASHGGDMFAAFYGHVAPPLLSVTSFLGVELFFVLSGFLIGGLLFEILDRGPSLRAWWVFLLRRWLRTLPLYVLVLAAIALLWPPPDRPLWPLLAGYATLTQNLAWPMPSDNWFGVSWSLTIEEWFYLLFSAALLGFAALTGGRRSCWWVILPFLAVPPLLRLLAGHWDNWAESVYRIVLLRLDAIAWGVALVRLERDGAALFRHPRGAATAGAALLVVAWYESGGSFLVVPRPVFLTLFPLLMSAGFALCFPLALRLRDGRGVPAGAARALSAQSYGLYLMHLTILEMLLYAVQRHVLAPPAAIVVAIALILGLPALSWRLIERPILALRPRQIFADPIFARQVFGGAAVSPAPLTTLPLAD